MENMKIQPLAPRQAVDLTKNRPVSQSLKLQGSEFKNVLMPRKRTSLRKKKKKKIQEASCLTQHVAHLFRSLSNVEHNPGFLTDLKPGVTASQLPDLSQTQ